MSRIMTIWLPRWPVQRRLIERPELRRRPVFVCRRERRGVMTVVAWAWAAPPRKTVPSVPAGGANPGRIPAGMSLAEAMAVLALSHGSRACHIAEVEHDDPVADLAMLEQLARYCRRFAPLVAIEKSPHHEPAGPECLYVDVTGTAGFFGGEGPLVRTVVWTLAARGIHARAAIADTPAAAWAAVHHTDALQNDARQDNARQNNVRQGHAMGRGGRRRRWTIVPPGTQLQTLAQLPATALRLDAAMLAQLRDVGIETVGGIARLPRKSLASRFAPQVSQRLAEFTGERPEPLVVPCSGELPIASQAFDFPLLLRDTSLDELVAVTERLVQDCVAPLAAQGKGVMSLQVRLERTQSVDIRETCPPAIIDIGVFQPSGSAQHLVELVRLRMARMRMPREIGGITVEVVSAGTAECRQRTLFGEAAETSASQVGMLLDRLSGRLGRGAVFEPKSVADAQPEHAWAAVPPAASRSKPELKSQPKRSQHAGSHAFRTPHRTTASTTAFVAAPQRRPIWLLPQPVRLETVAVVDSSLVSSLNSALNQQADATSGPPVRFRLASQSGLSMHEVVKAHGPERIETAWWRGPTVRRDYYVVETATGARYWIFRRLDFHGLDFHGLGFPRLGSGPAKRSGGEWFLHGTFA
jgi:protein ImuB